MDRLDIADHAGLVSVREVVGRHLDDRPLRRAHDDGETRRLRRGVYAEADRWAQLSPTDRYRAEVLAVVETRRSLPVIGYESAAALWRFPRFSPWPGAVHVIAEPGSAVRSKNGVLVHRESVDAQDIVAMDGILLTSQERTLVDVARTCRPEDSVAAIDRALNARHQPSGEVVTKELLAAALDRTVSARGIRPAAWAIGFADGAADNAGESVSRVIIDALGFPAPVLQQRHINPRGGYYFTDFEWPELMRIGEFDGRGKYLKDDYLGAQAPGDAVYDEKVREDHLRAEGYTVARWIYADLLQPEQLRRILIRAGLPIVRHCAFSGRK